MSSYTDAVNGAQPGQTNGVTPLTPVGTDFKAVAIGAGANIETLSSYFTDPLLQTGNMPGLAISSFNNRALRQGTFIASSLCLWISDQNQVYIPDDGSQTNWITQWQNALAAFVSALIPAGPDLGAYLPLAGGTMVGNILFQSGISTVLANNTWYYAKDSSGQQRGLIILGTNNDIVINDGSATNVHIAGRPTTNNNFAWSGTDTGGVVRPVIGLLSDNFIHIGSGGGITDLYFDVTANVHVASNITLANNHYITELDTGGTSRTLLGLNTSNECVIASAITSNTRIYAASGLAIYLSNTAYSLGTHQINGYTYIQGGGRAYIPGGNDPLQIYADNGFYARVHFVTAGTRDWSTGCLNNGPFAIADETAHAVRWQIDLNGNITSFGAQTVNSTFYVGGGTTLNGGATIYNGLNVASGNVWMAGSIVQLGNLSMSGQLWIGGLSGIYDGGGNWLTSGSNFHTGGSYQCDGNINCNNTITGYNFQSNGSINTNNTISGNQINAVNYIRDNGDLSVGGNCYVSGGCSFQHVSANNGLCVGGSGTSFDYTVAFPYANHTQWVGGLGVYAQFFASYSDIETKTNVSEVERDALAAILPIKFFQYDRPRKTPDGDITDARTHVTTGFIAQQVRESLPDAVVDTDEPLTFHEDHDPVTGAPACSWDMKPTLALDLATMLAYSLRAIQQLAARVEELEGRA